MGRLGSSSRRVPFHTASEPFPSAPPWNRLDSVGTLGPSVSRAPSITAATEVLGVGQSRGPGIWVLDPLHSRSMVHPGRHSLSVSPSKVILVLLFASELCNGSTTLRDSTMISTPRPASLPQLRGPVSESPCEWTCS